jgi:hypothetical protein
VRLAAGQAGWLLTVPVPGLYWPREAWAESGLTCWLGRQRWSHVCDRVCAPAAVGGQGQFPSWPPDRMAG